MSGFKAPPRPKNAPRPVRKSFPLRKRQQVRPAKGEKFFQISKFRERGVARGLRYGWRMHLRELLWPTMGLKAWLRWLGLTLVRQAENPHTVALGFAVGVWISFVPILGTHIVLALLLCSVVGGSYLAAMAGTFLCNPWTIGLMWWSAYEVGRRVLQLPKVNIRNLLEGHLTVTMVWEHAATLFHTIFLPMLLGGSLLGIPMALLLYLLVYWQVGTWRRKRLQKLQARQQQRPQ